MQKYHLALLKVYNITPLTVTDYMFCCILGSEGLNFALLSSDISQNPKLCCLIVRSWSHVISAVMSAFLVNTASGVV